MKNQRTKSERKFQPIKGIALLTMLALVTCLSAVLVFANTPVGPTPVLNQAAQDAMGIQFDASTGYWVKDYDGIKNMDEYASLVTVNLPDGSTVTATSVVVADENANAAGTTLQITYPADGASETISLPLRIQKKQLTWIGNGKGAETLQYDPSKTEYEVALDLNGAYLAGFVEGEGVTYNTEGVQLKVNAVSLTGEGNKIIVLTEVNCTAVGDTDLNNYILPALASEVEILPTSLTFDRWVNLKQSYHFGTDADGNGIYDALEIRAFAKDANDNDVELKVLVEVNGTTMSLNEAYAAGLYGNVLSSSDSGESEYSLIAVIPNDLYVLNAEAIHEVKKTVYINRAILKVSMVPEATYLTQIDLAHPDKVTPITYKTLVTGEGVPSEFLAQITYTYTDADGKVVSADGVSAPGAYTVTATLPTILTGENGAFCNYELVADGKLESKLIIKENYLTVGTADAPCQIIIVGENGIPNGVTATLTVPESISRKAIYGYHVHKEYTLQIKGSNGEAFKVLIPIDSALVSNPNCEPLTVKDLYLYDGIDSLLAASEKYKVSLSEDGAYYIIEGFNSTAAITFVIAPVYEAPFWVSAPGIALIILMILIVLLILFLIGLKVRQIERTDAENETLTVDTEGDAPEVKPVTVPDKIEDVDAVLEDGVNALAEELRSDVDPAAEETDGDVDATDAVAESLQNLTDEASEIDLNADAAAGEIDEMTEQMADNLAEELQETVEANDGTDISDDVDAAVADAMAENFNESADATDAIALIDEDDNDDDGDDEESDFSFGGYGSMPLTFIDAVAEAEKYNEMLEQEARGEVQLITRYRRSYLSRLAQSQDPIQDYYNTIKNLLLSYKGIKNRISWNYESFNLGRTQVAKFNAKTRTLYIYMALDPETLVDTKYAFADMSSKKKYAAVPVLMKIKGDRKFKHAVEMITMLCEEKLQLSKKKVVTEEDYKLPYMTTEALVQEGMIKKMVAAVPMSLINGEAETAPAPEETVATPAEETATEEVAVEEDVAAAAESNEESENV